MKIRAGHCGAILAAGLLLINAGAFAGAVVTKGNKAEVGKVTEAGGAVHLKIKYGKVTYKKSKVLWFTTSSRISTFYGAGRMAYKQGKLRVAQVLFTYSAQKELATRQNARRWLTRIKKELRPKPIKLPMPETADSTPKAKSAKEEEAKAAAREKLKDNVIYNAVKDDLVRMERGKLKPYEDEALATAEYYALYFSSSRCGFCHQFTPGLAKAYKGMQRRYRGKFEFILMSFDREEEAWQGYMKQYKMPWPAVKFSQVRRCGLMRYFSGGGIPRLVIVDASGKQIAVGQNKAIEALQDKLKESKKEDQAK